MGLPFPLPVLVCLPLRDEQPVMYLGSRKPPIICNLPGIHLWVLDTLCIVFFVSISISWRVAEVSLSLLTANITHLFVSSVQGLYVLDVHYGCYRSRQSEVGWAKWLHHPTWNIQPVLSPHSSLLTDPTGQLRVPEPVTVILASISRKTDSTERQTDR